VRRGGERRVRKGLTGPFVGAVVVADLEGKG